MTDASEHRSSGPTSLSAALPFAMFTWQGGYTIMPGALPAIFVIFSGALDHRSCGPRRYSKSRDHEDPSTNVKWKSRPPEARADRQAPEQFPPSNDEASAKTCTARVLLEHGIAARAGDLGARRRAVVLAVGEHLHLELLEAGRAAEPRVPLRMLRDALPGSAVGGRAHLCAELSRQPGHQHIHNSTRLRPTQHHSLDLAAMLRACASRRPRQRRGARWPALARPPFFR